MAGPSGQMETMSEATERLRAAGYVENWIAEGGMLRCFTCPAIYDPELVSVDEVVRFEGPSDPGDEAILFALGPVRPSRPVLRRVRPGNVGRGCGGHRCPRPHPAVIAFGGDPPQPGSVWAERQVGDAPGGAADRGPALRDRHHRLVHRPARRSGETREGAAPGTPPAGSGTRRRCQPEPCRPAGARRAHRCRPRPPHLRGTLREAMCSEAPAPATYQRSPASTWPVPCTRHRALHQIRPLVIGQRTGFGGVRFHGLELLRGRCCESAQASKSVSPM